MTPDERAAARARCREATPGPWWSRWGGEPGYVYSSSKRKIIAQLAHEMSDESRAVDADFLARARTDLPAALDALDGADRRIAELEALTLSQAERIAKQSDLLSRRAEHSSAKESNHATEKRQQ